MKGRSYKKRYRFFRWLMSQPRVGLVICFPLYFSMRRELNVCFRRTTAMQTAELTLDVIDKHLRECALSVVEGRRAYGRGDIALQRHTATVRFFWRCRDIAWAWNYPVGDSLGEYERQALAEKAARS